MHLPPSNLNIWNSLATEVLQQVTSAPTINLTGNQNNCDSWYSQVNLRNVCQGYKLA
jgi:hypothetical protein